MITRGDLAYPGYVMSQVSYAFEETFYATQSLLQWSKIATAIEVDTPIVKYPFLGASPHMKEFKDRMDDQGVAPYLVTIEDQEWYINMRITAKALEDDATNLFRMRASGFGEAAARFDDEQAFLLLDNGFTGIGYDGQAFFSASHVSGGSGTQSNVTNAPLSATSLQAAVGAMGSYKDDLGRPFGSRGNVLVVGPLLEMRARELIQSPIVVAPVGSGTAATGATAATGYGNVLQNYFELVVDPWITGYHWFVLDNRRQVRPIIIQNRTDVPFRTWNDLDDPQAMRKREFNFSGFVRKGFGYGPWQTAYGSNATA